MYYLTKYQVVLTLVIMVPYCGTQQIRIDTPGTLV